MIGKIVLVAAGLFVVVAATLYSCTPAIPHAIDAKRDCLSCHALTKPHPYPAWHATHGFDNDECGHCHDLKISDPKPE